MGPKIASETKLLFGRRTIILNGLDRFRAYLDEFDPEVQSVVELKLRTSKFEKCWDDFVSIQDRIEVSSPDPENELLVRRDFEDRYFSCAADAQNLIPSGSSLNASAGCSHSNDMLDDFGVKLQPISLPKFDGRYEEWLSFSDMFRSAVHENKRIPPIRKFYCLRNCLTGTAANVIKNIETTEANYSGAWELIEKRFSNKRLITQRHVTALFELPRLGKENSHELRALSDNTLKHMQALRALGQPTDTWDTLIVHLTSSKFDPATFKAWQEFSPNDDLPSLDDLFRFLTQRCQILEALPQSGSTPKSTTTSGSSAKSNENKAASQSKWNKQIGSSLEDNSCYHAQVQLRCSLCSESHGIFSCPRFLNLAVENRINKVNELKLCPNCLKPNNHSLANCKSRKCKFCDQSHNSYLHRDPPVEIHGSQNEGKSSVISAASGCSSKVILSTALIRILNANGELVPCRVLLDCGSQSNFLTESMCHFLGLKRSKSNSPISGINGTSTQVAYKTRATIQSSVSDFRDSTTFLVIPQITSDIPGQLIQTQSWNMPAVPLADPAWNSPSRVDGLLGAQIFWNLLLEGKIVVQSHPVTLRETKLGWVVCGCTDASLSFAGLCHLSSLSEVDEHLQSFWKLEDVSATSVTHTGEDHTCETQFQETVSRTKDGRYMVQLPFRQDPTVLGESRHAAMQRFLKLETRLIRQPELYTKYKEFMAEYLQLGHMKESDSSTTGPEYFIPHHCIQKESSSTTKLRVVFDASAKTSSGKSLNDILMVGPCIQDSLLSILLRYRMYNFIMSADVEKMYRQTLIDPSQTALQKIFWREDRRDLIKIYELRTITYGTACAPYLATRALKRLFEDEHSLFPHASNAIKDFYMDDFLSGFNTVTEGLNMQDDLIKLLSRGKLHLRKWCSTHPELLSSIADEDKEPLQTFHFQDDSAAAIKTLGLIFDPQHDAFRFSVRSPPAAVITKRNMISDIALIFDPLGVIGPVIVKAKMFMQELWREGFGWDEPIPSELAERWINFRKTFRTLETITIPRQVTVNPPNSLMEIHAFSDASESAYGTCIYIRSVDRDTGCPLGVHLLCSKSRVAPLKSTSLPRLELAAALLMAQLAEVVRQSLKVGREEVFYWTDSTVVLSWINAASTSWVTFVANRVAKIQELTKMNNWHHISGVDNPADIISRGLYAELLAAAEPWWHGPAMLMKQHGVAESWNSEFTTPADIPERRNTKIVVLLSTTRQYNILHKFSSIKKLVRVMAYVRRFLHNTHTTGQSTHLRQSGQLTVRELESAMSMVLRLTQQEVYTEEIRVLRKHQSVTKSSKLADLHPYLDAQQLLRVGGRIRHANVHPDQKNPVILPPNHPITRLIARDKHEELHHCGAQSLLAALRLQYWPINGRHLTRSITQQCITCFKVKPSYASQLMGDLPSPRVNPSRPFTHTGLDYFGPIMVKLNNSRKGTKVKAHVALFVCLATKALHLEVVEDQSTESFLAALRRFISRRGKPSIMYSDNASTFKGASNQLQQWLSSQQTQEEISNFTDGCGIQWKFIPPYTPHIGGLWESNVKRVKYHLRRTMGPHVLTYVNLYTLLTEIEAIVNSRPLFPLSNDPSDFSFLTLAHFLVGAPLTAPPEPDLQSLPINRLDQWQLVQRLLQNFWTTWKSGYLSELQKRTKWKTDQPNLAVGTLALIHDDKTAPMNWKMGRIMEIHTGADNKVRVVSLRTSSGVITRSIFRICPLPLTESSTDPLLQDSSVPDLTTLD